jgi:hypothetical protein
MWNKGHEVADSLTQSEISALEELDLGLMRQSIPSADAWRLLLFGLAEVSVGRLAVTTAGRHTLAAIHDDKALQRQELGGTNFDCAEWEALLMQLGEISGRIATLATRMPLTTQSRYGPRAADTAARTGGEEPKPWDQ